MPLALRVGRLFCHLGNSNCRRKGILVDVKHISLIGGFMQLRSSQETGLSRLGIIQTRNLRID